jgi:hypothetical protein
MSRWCKSRYQELERLIAALFEELELNLVTDGNLGDSPFTQVPPRGSAPWAFGFDGNSR